MAEGSAFERNAVFATGVGVEGCVRDLFTRDVLASDLACEDPGG